MGVLYKLTSPSGKSYIGISSKTLDDRWAKHVEHALGKRTNGALYAALRKYGPDKFVREVLATEDDWDALCDLERLAISEHHTFSPHGYNVTLGGEGITGPRSDEVRATISVAQKRRYERADQREALAQYGKRGNATRATKSAIRKAALRQARAEYRQSEAFKTAHSNQVKVALSRPEVRAKMNQCARDRAQSPTWRSKISSSKTGQKIGPQSEEHKQRIAEAPSP